MSMPCARPSKNSESFQSKLNHTPATHEHLPRGNGAAIAKGMTMATMRINDGKGFGLTFDNGITISVQIGGGNYCDNYGEPIGRFSRPENYELPASKTAEIAAWDETGNWLTLGDDEIRGYVPVEDVFRFAALLQSLPSDLEKAEIELSTNAFDWRV